MKTRFLFPILLALAACSRPTPPPAPPATPAETLHAVFAAGTAVDTVHFFLPDSAVGAPVPDSLLKLCLDSTQFNSLHYETGEARFYAVEKRALTGDTDACLLYTQEFWFGKLSLLFYDRPNRRFYGVQEVSSFYGGDGGQVAVESWLLSYTGVPHLYAKTAQHGFIPGEEPKEYYDEAGALLRWDGRAFQPVVHPDSAAWLAKFRMEREF